MPQVCSVLGLLYRVRSAAAGEACWPGISLLCLLAGPALKVSLEQEEKDHGPWEGLRTGVVLAEDIAEKGLNNGMV